jgi:hypothetical protein
MELVLHESLRCYCAMVETDLLGEIVPMVRVWMPICRPENKVRARGGVSSRHTLRCCPRS